MKRKDSFIIHDGFFDLLSALPPEKCKEILIAYGNYALNGEEPVFDDPIMAAIFKREKAIIDSDNRKYSEISKIRRQAIMKRYGKKSDSDTIQMNTNEYKSSFCSTKSTDTDTDTDTDTLNNLPYPPEKEGDKKYVDDKNSNDDTRDRSSPQKRKEKSSAKKEKIDLFEMGIDIDMIPVVEKWMAYKTERHESYKRKGIEMFYKRLMELSGGSVIRAEKIIEQSMANNYAGIFALKSMGNGKESRSEQEEIESLMRAVAEGIAIARTPQQE